MVEEADEPDHWLNVVADAEMLPRDQLTRLIDEAQALTKMFARMAKTSRDNDKDDGKAS